jgi:hypothetical protein
MKTMCSQHGRNEDPAGFGMGLGILHLKWSKGFIVDQQKSGMDKNQIQGYGGYGVALMKVSSRAGKCCPDLRQALYPCPDHVFPKPADLFSNMLSRKCVNKARGNMK